MTRLVKIALFVIVTGAGSIFYVMETAETINAPDTYMVKAMIEDASGLLPGTGVRVAGVNIGRVREVELVEGQAQLLMEISTEVRLHHDAVVQRTMDSMLGNSIVTLQPGSPNQPPIMDGGMIRDVRSETAMDQMFISGQKATEEMALFMEEFNSFMETGGYSSLQDLLDIAGDSVKTTNILIEKNLTLLAESLESINSITSRMEESSARNIDDLSRAVTYAADISEHIDTLLRDRDSGINTSMSSIQESIDRLNTTLTNLESITSKIDRGEGNIGKLVNDDQLYERIDRVAKNVDELVNSAAGMDVQVGFRSEYLTLQNDFKNETEVRFVPDNASKYYSIGMVAGPSFKTTETITETVTTGTPASLEENTRTLETVMTNDMKISAQLARSFGPLTLRGGLIESSAGFGIQYQPFEKFAVDAELFDFDQEETPYLRSYGTFFPLYDPDSRNLFNWLYLSGGVDNALHGENRDFFIGLGLRLTDNDLRTVLPFVPMSP